MLRKYDDPRDDRILYVIQYVLLGIAVGCMLAKDTWPSVWWGVVAFVSVVGLVCIGAYRQYSHDDD